MLIAIRGAGDIASGIAVRLFRCGFSVVMSDIAEPTAIRRTVCFSEAIRLGSARVEGISAARADSAEDARRILSDGRIAVLVDSDALLVRRLCPDVLVDAILAKRNLGTSISDAPLVIGVGPGFTAGVDCHAVVETMRGHTLGRVCYEGSAKENTGVPGSIGGYTTERILRAPCDGVFLGVRRIGDTVRSGEACGYVDGAPMCAQIDGVLRGILPDGTAVTRGMKSGDVDPRCERSNCFTVSDKALAVGGGVLEAILALRNR